MEAGHMLKYLRDEILSGWNTLGMTYLKDEKRIRNKRFHQAVFKDDENGV